MPIHAVLFDMDGLMFDTERLYDTLWTEIATEFGLPMHASDMSFLRGLNNADARATFLARYGDLYPYDDMCEAMTQAFDKHTAVHVPILDGLPELLAHLKAHNVPMAVVSSTDKELVARHLQVAGIRDYFSALVCGNMVAHSKPAPDIFLLAAQTLGAAPEHCMVLEDSHNGIRAGHAANCFTVMVPNCDVVTEEMQALADAIVPTLHEVIALLATAHK